MENLIFNLGDVLRNTYEAQSNLLNEDFTDYGVNIGYIVADLFYINPMKIFTNKIRSTLWT